MNKHFTVWQLFSIIDGRLSTKMEDVYEILDTASGESLMTHHLPVASRYFKETKPKWYATASAVIDNAKKTVGNDFKALAEYFGAAGENAPTIDVAPIPESEKESFGRYMVDNSLLRKMAV